MITLTGVSGSLRQGSFNTALLRAAAEEAGDDVVLHLETLHGIPLYDGDLEQRDGIPRAVMELRRRIEASDGMLIATPEYNNSVPGVAKNAVDWLSRKVEGEAPLFAGRKVAILGASPGGFGTILAQSAWLPVMRTLKARLWFDGRLMVSRAGQAFDDGRLVDDDVRKRLREFVAGFAEFAGGD